MRVQLSPPIMSAHNATCKCKQLIEVTGGARYSLSNAVAFAGDFEREISELIIIISTL